MSSTQKPKVVIACRQAADSLLPEHETGYFCRSCGKELQVSPRGRIQIREGGTPICNTCARELAEQLKPAAVHFNPSAKESMGPSFPRYERSLFESLGTTTERMPSGRLATVETVGARGIPEDPQWLVCDCCCERRDRLWLWRHYGFCMKLPGQYSSREFMAGAWSFCVYCKPLMSQRRLLVARVASLNPDLDAAVLDQTYDVMLRCLYGEAHEWQSGQPLPKLT